MANFINELFKVILLLLYINFVALRITNAKRISFWNKFNEVSENKKMLLEEYDSYLSQITNENNLTFKYANINNVKYFQPYLKEKSIIIPGENLKLFSIHNDFIINKNLIAKNEYYDTFYSKLLDQGKFNISLINIDNVLALFILSQINLKENSIFFYFLRNLPMLKTPILYEFISINLFKEDDTFGNLIEQIKYNKKNYNELRSLVFSHGKEIKDKFIGSFLLGDYLWAL